MLWIWLTAVGNIQPVYAASKQHQQFPDIPFSLFSRFVEDHFISTVSLSTVLMVLFTITQNTDLLNLHFYQKSAENVRGHQTSATGWIRHLGNAVKTRLEDHDAKLLKSDINNNASEKNKIVAIALELDALAKILGLCPLNKQGSFQRKLKAVSHKEVQPVYTICPNTATCKTLSCNKSALYQWTRARDIPLVTFIRDFGAHDKVPVLSGHCKECKTLYYADHERSSPIGQGQHERVYINSAKYIKIGGLYTQPHILHGICAESMES
jgi:hypothetical protein